jgi:hypothetical protein
MWLFVRLLGMAYGSGGPSPADDEVERRLRELTEEISGAARIREPSAAEREKAGRKLSKARAREARARGSRGRRAVGWSVAVVILAGAGLFAWHQGSRSGLGGPNDTQVVTNGAVPRTSASQTPASSPAANPNSGPSADPFASTPADHWADGVAGITIPAAAPHGPFTASEVAAAYATTRKLLIAQNLDQKTLLGGAPTQFADVLTTQQRAQFTAGLDKIGLDKQGAPLSTRGWVTSFAPGTTVLIGTVIKVYGTMSARSAVDQGRTVLDIDVNYRFVYPVEPPHAPADWMRVVGQVQGYIEFEDWQDPGGPIQPWVVTAVPSDTGGRCGMTDGYIHPDYPGGPPDKVQPSGTPMDPYSMKNDPDTNEVCQAATRT